MTILVATLLILAFTVDYFAVSLAVIPRAFTLVPDVLAVIIALTIIGRLLVLRRWEQSPKYLWMVAAFILACTIALIAENVAPGVIVAGIRFYFKYLPLLFLPAVFRFSDRDITILVGVFLFLACIQVPLAFYQRFVQFAEFMHTGDPVTGMMSTSSSLTVILCIALALIITLYVKGKIGLIVTLLLFGYLASPTTINETKATLLLLPLAVLAPFVLSSGVKNRWRKLVPVLGICAVGLIGYVVVYNTLVQFRWEGRDIDQFLMSGDFSWYLYRGAEAGSDPERVGRLDSITLPIQVLSEKWMQLLFGVGIGNASPSFLAELNGAYADEFKIYGYGKTAIGNLLWEVGLVGLLIYMAIFVSFFLDAKVCAREDRRLQWAGTWWSVAVLVMMLALLYKPILQFNEAAYFLFLWAGIFSSRAWNIRHAQAEGAASAPVLKLAGRESSVNDMYSSRGQPAR